MTKRLLLILFALALFSFGVAKTLTRSEFEDEIFRLTNLKRHKHGLHPLYQEDGLEELARRHARDMSRFDYFDHEDREGMLVAGRQQKYYKEMMVLNIGENLAYYEHNQCTFSPSKIVSGWMNSPGHRANILNKEFTHMGVAVALISDKLYAVQIFCCPVVRLHTLLPSRFKKDHSYELEFEYLNWRDHQNLEAFLILPDPQTRVPIGDKYYMEGVQPLSVKWGKGSQMLVELPFIYGKGRYKLAFGWGNGFYESNYSITVK